MGFRCVKTHADRAVFRPQRCSPVPGQFTPLGKKDGQGRPCPSQRFICRVEGEHREDLEARAIALFDVFNGRIRNMDAALGVIKEAEIIGIASPFNLFNLGTIFLVYAIYPRRSSVLSRAL